MTSKSELQLALRLALILGVAGLFCFAAFPVTPPERPVRLAYQTKAGKVIFDHKTHLSETGYGLDCGDCHHHTGDGEAETEEHGSCGDCHVKPEEAQLVSETCNECHDPEDYDLEELTARADAFHSQCITCHEDFEAGPVECAACHVM
jgi:c(7)-type cytochrome triheme protein